MRDTPYEEVHTKVLDYSGVNIVAVDKVLHAASNNTLAVVVHMSSLGRACILDAFGGRNWNGRRYTKSFGSSWIQGLDIPHPLTNLAADGDKPRIVGAPKLGHISMRFM